MPKYSAFGLNVESEIRLPLLRSSFPDSQMDLRIRKGNIPDGVRSKARTNYYNSLPGNEIIFKIPEIAFYWIRENEIVIEPQAQASPAAIQLYLLGSAMAPLLHRENALVLHGSAIKVSEDGAILIVGLSGAGKSSLSAAFIEVGYEFLSDDVSVIRGLSVYPSYPQMKLWRSTLEVFGWQKKGRQQIFNRMDKFNVNLSKHFVEKALRIKAVYEVTIGEYLGSHRLVGKDAFAIVHNHTYRVEFLNQIGDRRRHFTLCSNLTNEVPVVRLVRPKLGTDPRELIAHCLKFLETKENVFDEFTSPITLVG